MSRYSENQYRENQVVGRSVYAGLVAYVTQHGWQRVDEGEGWWWHDHLPSDTQLGTAVEFCLHWDDVDVREDPK
jgi:hypothetical protein